MSVTKCQAVTPSNVCKRGAEQRPGHVGNVVIALSSPESWSNCRERAWTSPRRRQTGSPFMGFVVAFFSSLIGSTQVCGTQTQILFLSSQRQIVLKINYAVGGHNMQQQNTWWFCSSSPPLALSPASCTS